MNESVATATWALLVTTLPSRPGATRLRLWRALKALGCASLRDGAWALPASQAPALQALADEVRQHGGTAWVLDFTPRDAHAAHALRAMFDRSAGYAAWGRRLAAWQRALPGLEDAVARRRLRGLADDLAALRRTDHLPGADRDRADAALAAARATLQARLSPGEPRALQGAPLPRLNRADFAGRRWATRARPWVDRLACAWLIRRFIDPAARFVWLADPARPPRGVIGFDYDGARFTHVGPRVSFEVLAESFGLLADDPALARIAAAVHVLDIGGVPVPEAPGLQAVLGGLRALHADDDALTAAASTVFDALYAQPTPETAA